MSERSDIPGRSGPAPESTFLRRVLSHDCGAFWQFVKYGVIGSLATIVQTAVLYLLAATVCRCLAADDWAVVKFGLPSVDISDAERSIRFVIDVAAGFMVSNIFCWLLNRAFVFRPGRFRWYVEFGMFFGSAAFAWALATGLSALLIRCTGLMTSIATVLQVVVSFAVNYAARRFFIFRG